MSKKLFLTGIICLLFLSDAKSQDRNEPTFSYGMRQVEQLLDDRPDMRNVFNPGDPIFQWVVERFDRGDQGRRVFWDHTEPVSMQSAAHIPSYGTYYPAVIRLSSAGDTTPLDKWVFVIFELINMNIDREGERLRTELLGGKIGIDAFALRLTELEHQAMVKTIDFLEEMKIRSLATSKDQGVLRFLATPKTFDVYVKDVLDSDPEEAYDPRRHFAEYATRILKRSPSSYKNQEKSTGFGDQGKDSRKISPEGKHKVASPDDLIEID